MVKKPEPSGLLKKLLEVEANQKQLQAGLEANAEYMGTITQNISLNSVGIDVLILAIQEMSEDEKFAQKVRDQVELFMIKRQKEHQAKLSGENEQPTPKLVS